MGLVLGVLGGTFVLGAFTKVATTFGTYVAFIVASIVIIWVKYTQPQVSIWSYSLITIGISVVVGVAVSAVQRKMTNDTSTPDPVTTIYGIQSKGKEETV